MAAKSCRRILGTPAAGETANGETFDGETEVATFPGDLPADPEELFKGDALSRPLQHALPRRPTSASCASGRRCSNAKATASPRCLTSALTAPSSS